MVFGLSTALAVGTAAVGVGLSAAGAAGAFDGKVDKFEPTPEELEAAKRSRELFEFGQRLQRGSDQTARKDLATLKSAGEFNRKRGEGASTAVGQITPTLQAGLSEAGRSSGGPGSGRWASQLGVTGAMLDAAKREGATRGGNEALRGYIGRRGQYLERLTGDVDTGMNLMEQGAQSAQQRQAERINAQVGQNLARGQAIGQMGGALTSVGMAGLGGMGGVAGAAGTAATQAGKGVSVMKPIKAPSFEQAFPNLKGY